MTTPTPPMPAGVTAAARLRNGQLRAMVAKVLADASGAPMTPRAIAAQLGGRSSGAVGNALHTLADQGHATITGTAPVTYQATTTTAGVAAAAIVPAPPVTPRPRPNATPAPVTGPITRPNGAAYHPRTLSGMPDVTALRRLRDAGVPALMYGPPGTGKTSVIEASFPDLETVPGDGDTVVADFVGDYTKTDDGRYVFVYGPLIRAMRAGSVLFIDDATIIPPTVLAVVYPAMDGRRQIVIKANGGETVTAAPGFYVVAGHNPGVHGAILSDALASRFSAQIKVSTDYDLAAELKIDSRAVKVARNLSTRQAKGEIGWAPQLRELLAYQKIADALGENAAAGNLIGIAPEEDRDTVATVVRAVFGTAVEPLALGARA
ncbi:AAA family ATPase [Actinokineospora auranticolor]|uniref:Dynein-related subfamily AAA family protein n=1 Tax=Actinokineospora auranticolor TaxID=155976 RepID=A0A2S6GDS7_9PSEU|nr:AAA family ATPase [Actinokineospora auranticolor]PPK63373.1 dynein-related subfamily AAA family protein [Actinokineospora auranticolor]